MRSSRKYLDEGYTKLFQIDQPQPQQHPKIKVEEKINNPATDEISSYAKQNQRAKSYLQNNGQNLIHIKMIY